MNKRNIFLGLIISFFYISCNFSTENSKKTEPKTELSYILDYRDKYPSDVDLLENGKLKDRLLTLLGKDIYQTLIDNITIQTPIKIINNKRTLINGAAPHSFGSDEGAIYIDFELDKITVGILNDTQVKVFSEISSNPETFKDEFYNWYSKAKENAKNNNSQN